MYDMGEAGTSPQELLVSVVVSVVVSVSVVGCRTSVAVRRLPYVGEQSVVVGGKGQEQG